MSKITSYLKNIPAVSFLIALIAIFGVALFLRTYFPHDNVFAGDWVRFQINDPWFHMRNIENLVYHFPQIMEYDPYYQHPSTYTPDGVLRTAPFFDWVIGLSAWIIGLGSPSKHIIDTVGALAPAIMGALVTIPVFFIGKTIFNKTAGIIAAALIAIMPGQFLMRSLLGFTDNHVAEVFFTTFTVMFLVLGLKSAKNNNISFSSIAARDWRSLRAPIIYSILAGLSIALYNLSWNGAGLFVFIIFLFMIIQFISDHLRGRPADYLCIVGSITFFVAVIIIGPVSGLYGKGHLQFYSLLIGCLAVIGSGVLSALLAKKYGRETFHIRLLYLPLLAALAGIAYLILHFGFSAIHDSIFSQLQVFSPDVGKQTTSEVQPLTWEGAWNQFNSPWILAILSTIVVSIIAIIRGDAKKTMLVIWSICMFIFTMDLSFTEGQQRYAYYLAVNIALMAGFFGWMVLRGVNWLASQITGQRDDSPSHESTSTAKEITKSKKIKRKKVLAQQKKKSSFIPVYFNVRFILSIIALLTIFFITIYPYIIPFNKSYQLSAITWAEGKRGASDDWYEALSWLKNNSPEPFPEGEDYFYELYPTNKPYEPPESAYGIMSWWDYGYWITYLAHRIPHASPGSRGHADTAGQFFAAQDEETAMAVMEETDCKYAIIDYEMATSKFYAMAIYAGKSVGDYFGTYWFESEGELTPISLFYPEFYQSMCTRLFIFGGDAWDPYEDWTKNNENNWIQVIAYEQKTDLAGTSYREITGEERFKTYEEAVAFVEANPRYLIVSTNPLLSPVPLEKLEHFKLVHESPGTYSSRDDDILSKVQVFEYSANGWQE